MRKHSLEGLFCTSECESSIRTVLGNQTEERIPKQINGNYQLVDKNTS